MRRTPPDEAADRGRRGGADERALLAAAGELALGVWACLSLLGIALGLLLASLAQVWARTVWAPGAVLGGLLVLASAGLTPLASHRCQVAPGNGSPSLPMTPGSRRAQDA